MPDYIPGVSPVDQIYLLGTKFNTEVRQGIIRAEFSASTDQTSQISMTIIDRGFKLLKAGMIADHMRTDFIGFWMEIASIGTGDSGGAETLELRMRPKGVRALMERTGSYVVHNASPTQFLAAECKAVGLGFKGQSSGLRNQVSRDVPVGDVEGQRPPSSWTTFQRLAQELGYLMFEFKNVVYFGKPSWLIKNTGSPVVTRYAPGKSAIDTTMTIPACSRSDDDPDGTRVSVVLPSWRIPNIGPGRLQRLVGVPTFDADYMVNSITFDMLQPNSVVTVDAQKPIDPKVTSANQDQIPLTSYPGTTRRGTKLAGDFVAWALAQLGDKYIFGVEAPLSNPNPLAFDCSELVEWAAYQVGVYMPDGTFNQEPYLKSKNAYISVASAKNIRGALLYTDGHVAISLGDGNTTIEAMNEQAGVRKGNISNRFPRAALIPGMTYPGATGWL